MESERIAREALRALRVEEPCGGFDLARRRWGGGRIWWVSPTEVWGESELIDGGILLAEGLTIERENFRVALHVGEDFMAANGVPAREAAGAAEGVAAALLMPPAPFLRVLWSRTIVDTARAFRVQEQAAWLRLGETTGSGVAVVAPERVRVAGVALPWEPRALARADILPRGLRRTEITDQVDRVALIAALFRAPVAFSVSDHAAADLACSSHLAVAPVDAALSVAARRGAVSAELLHFDVRHLAAEIARCASAKGVVLRRHTRREKKTEHEDPAHGSRILARSSPLSCALSIST